MYGHPGVRKGQRDTVHTRVWLGLVQRECSEACSEKKQKIKKTDLHETHTHASTVCNWLSGPVTVMNEGGLKRSLG